MTLQSSGAISLDDIHEELGESSGTTVSLGDDDVRDLADDTDGAISMNTFYGKSDVPPVARAIFASGAPSSPNVMDYVTVNSTGNASDFGDLAQPGQYCRGAASKTRAIFRTDAGYGNVHYVTIASTGNSSSHSTITYGAQAGGAACSDGVYAYYGGGIGSAPTAPYSTQSYGDVHQETIASTGGSWDVWGTMTVTRYLNQAASSSTRKVMASGVILNGGNTTSIQYRDGTSSGYFSNFGTLVSGGEDGSACANETRMLMSVGGSASVAAKTVHYITIASTGNSTDYGDLTADRSQGTAESSTTRAIFGGGHNSQTQIQYRAIASTGNYSNFGDLTVGRHRLGSACTTPGS